MITPSNGAVSWKISVFATSRMKIQTLGKIYRWKRVFAINHIETVSTYTRYLSNRIILEELAFSTDTARKIGQAFSQEMRNDFDSFRRWLS